MAKKKSQTKKKAKATTGPKNLKIPCLKIEQHEQSMYLFSMRGKELFNLVEINRRQEDKEKGYQRALSSSRVRKIAKFIDEKNIIPGCILVSFDKGAEADGGTALKIPNIEKAGWVVDGQHRLAGAHEAREDISFPVVAFINLPVEKQIDYFVTINREQKGVPASLYFDLLKLLPRLKSEKEMLEERTNDLVNALKRDEKSPFFRRIVAITSPRDGQISSVNFIRKVSVHLKPDGALAAFNDDERTKVLSNYYSGLSIAFPEIYEDPKTVFFKTVGFGALMEVLPTFIDTTYRRAGKTAFRVADVAGTFKMINDFDFSSWKQGGSGSAAEKQAAADLRTVLLDASSTLPSSGVEL